MAVEALGILDLVVGKAATPHGYVVEVEDGANRAPVDLERLGELVHGRAGPVVGDQLLGLVVVEPTTTATRGGFF
ncbi:hypothetical protein [Amycolatopsis cihanbeyliensis]|uniref:hypothetical protein n=1 Tax=Amycolatopsis cihanbeyliensis TaxID=1128664 RepID=UPI001B880E0D|nr:hypothetical protein [Amycolatopsis cihanbeyliensis]